MDIVSRSDKTSSWGHRTWPCFAIYMSNLRNVKIRFRARILFRHNEHLAGPALAHAGVLKSHQWLDTLQTHGAATRSYGIASQDTTEYHAPSGEKRDGKTASANSLFYSNHAPSAICRDKRR
ncbi:hypothetical protein FIBSPDRAFT_96022 [Athelia psychrophila]|uniref:Uncharacterized protein n=1 Tax=Athelia psychrophila TaxID=1759441 RepID=A0A166DT28_9AGAM|nr:hypothetical protein FIBSPDRAFT_96022 [Fibularhizoctonia sp. CBS 109695]